MEYDPSSDIEDETLHHPEYKDVGSRITGEFDEFTAENQSYTSEESHHSVYPTGLTGEKMNTPLPGKGRTPRRTGKGRPSIFSMQPPVIVSEEAITGNSHRYTPSLPFQEAGPTSNVWRAYLDERFNHDTDMFGNQRGELNIHLVFAGLFSAVVTTFISQSSVNLQPDYQQISALLLFDLINIQRAFVNGTSLDLVTTSGADPTAPFTPKKLDSVINGLWYLSLALSLAIASFAIIADQWYASYLSHISGTPKVRARIRHFRHHGLTHSRIRLFIEFLPSTLRLSLYLFFVGLVLYVTPQQKEIAILIGTTILLLFTIVNLMGFWPLIYPWSPYKVPETETFYRMSQLKMSKNSILLPIFTKWVRGIYTRLQSCTTELLSTKPGNHTTTFADVEISAAEESRIENEVDALHWLYQRSSMSADHRLVIHALPGLPAEHIMRAREAFSPYWDELRDEKERMLIDCMKLSGKTWVPRDDPNIDRRIEPILRLEILFPELRRQGSAGLVRGHKLDFSKELSNTLSITLFFIDDTHVRKPAAWDQDHGIHRPVIMDALVDNNVHHLVIWNKLLERYVDKEKFLPYLWDSFTIEICLSLVTSIYLPKESPHKSCSCTLADILVTFHKSEILNRLLSFFKEFDFHQDADDQKRRLSLAIVRALMPDSAPFEFNSPQPYPLHRNLTVSTYQLLQVALRVIHKDIDGHVHRHWKQWRTDVSSAIFSCMTSDLFTGHALSNLKDSEFKDTIWTCRAYFLASMVLLIRGVPQDCVIEWKAELAKEPLLLNILEIIHDKRVPDAPLLPAVRVPADPSQRGDSIIRIVGLLLGQAFASGIPKAYDAFREKGSLHYIAEKSTVHLEFIEGFRGYITGLSEAKAGKFPDIQSDEFLDWHIQDLHQAPVIRCICASIAHSGIAPRPILSSLASIAPHHNEWSNILEILKSLDHEYSVECYTLDPAEIGMQDKLNRLKKGMKEIVSTLCQYLEEEKGRNKDIKQVSTIHQGSEWPSNPNTDVELGVLNVDVS